MPTLLAAASCGPIVSLEYPLAVGVIAGPDLDTLLLRHGIERGHSTAEGLTATTIPEPDPDTGLHTLVDGGSGRGHSQRQHRLQGPAAYPMPGQCVEIARIPTETSSAPPAESQYSPPLGGQPTLTGLQLPNQR
ncbi:hypothetical protein [Amycolatopsis sp. TNS106]|uniref:hypothetical protein n=1 Tax=Amycolatopsis sp. TNS106 TaxID=2861750 RepID=UPI001C584879|nr:hypothetical protein [Amycolatopsis sp. TNS106]QXV57487.1 hypothetical protein CVV72_11105 [Amycolatopsis sp. TNS106]